MFNRRTFMRATAGASLAVVLSGLPAFAQTVSGTFRGASRHTTAGGVTVVTKDGRTVISLASDFVLDSGPDPVVGLGKDGRYDPKSFSGALAKLKGAQEYTLPDGVDASAYNEVYIWCRAADVPLGIADLK